MSLWGKNQSFFINQPSNTQCQAQSLSLCLALQTPVDKKFLSRIQISTGKSWPVMWELENIHLFCRVHWEITCSCVGNSGEWWAWSCYPSAFPIPVFLMPKYVIIPFLHSGLTEKIKKYSSAYWVSTDPGCTWQEFVLRALAQSLPIKKWRGILTPKPSTAEQVTV